MEDEKLGKSRTEQLGLRTESAGIWKSDPSSSQKDGTMPRHLISRLQSAPTFIQLGLSMSPYNWF